MNAIVVGLCGRAGAGKNTVAEFLRDYGFCQIAFADPIYDAIEAITGLGKSSLSDRVVKETPIEWLGGKSPRRLLQLLGTEFGRQMISDDVWISLLLRRVKNMIQAGHHKIAITDVRFDNEAEAIRDRLGGIVVEVVRGSLGPGLEAAAASHSSERGVSRRLIDSVIENAGLMDDLRWAVAAFAVDVGRQYRAENKPAGV
jgi:hypothetical protein